MEAGQVTIATVQQGDGDLFGGRGKKREDTMATIQVELTALLNVW